MLSPFNYVNSLFFGLPDTRLDKLQMVQNNTVRLIWRRMKRDHVTRLLKYLHTTYKHIKNKILLPTNKSFSGEATYHISNVLHPSVLTKPLRSA